MFGGEEWLIIAIVALVLFGGAQIPKLARNLGEAQRELKKAMASSDDEVDTDDTDDTVGADDDVASPSDPADVGTPPVS